MSRTRVFVVVLVSLLVVLTVGVSSASAGKGVVGSFGEAGSGVGQFTSPTGVGVAQASGDVYVLDAPFGAGEAGGQRVEQFAQDGSFVRAWGWGVATGAEQFEICTSNCLAGVGGSGDGQLDVVVQGEDFAFAYPQVAVDQSDGSVYVADVRNDRVQKFSATGGFIAKFGGSGTGDGQLNGPQGVAVDPVTHDVYVADTANNRVQRFTSGGVYVSQLGGLAGGSGDGEFLGPRRVAVDSTGRLYVLDDGNGRIQRFGAGGVFDGVFGSGSVVVGGAFQPNELAVDPADDHVYFVGTTGDFSTSGVIELDPSGVVADVHAPNAGVLFGGVAVRSSSGRVYASELFGSRVLELDEVAAPTVAIGPVTEITGTSATFGGSVNPQGPPSTGYRFEYSTDGATWTSVPNSDVPVGSGTADVEVSQTAVGLVPNTEYRVRLVATKDFNAGGATSGEVTFSTAIVPPQARTLGAGNVTATAAWLAGEVNPRNFPTSAYLEYTIKSDTEYANSSRIPAAPDDVDVGSANDYVTIIQLATGLQAGTDYRFRVVATNGTDVTLGPDRVFTTRKALPEAPAGRGYEMVSPADKNGGDIDRNISGQLVGASVSGDAVAYASLTRFAGADGGNALGQYRSVRDQAGWSTRATNPPFRADTTIDINGTVGLFLSDDALRTVVVTNFPLAPLSPLLGTSGGLYLQDNSGGSSSYRLLSAPDHPIPPQSARYPFNFEAATPSMSHVVFESAQARLTDDPLVNQGVYEWADGQVRLVNRLPSGAFPESATAGAGSGSGRFHPGEHVISDDGRRIFFSTGGGNGAAPLYVREDGAATRAVSASERDDDLSTVQPAKFLAAKADDGSLALFTSNFKLTDDATACGDLDSCSVISDDLYLWDASGPEGGRLTDLTTADPDGGGVSGIAAVADDLSRIFFVANGDLADGAVDGRQNLYVWSAAAGVRHVATLSDNDAAVWATERINQSARYRDARLSGNGSRLLFASRARMTAQDTGGTKQIYLYDDAERRLMCVSCTGSTPTGDSWLLYSPDFGALSAPYRLPRNLSADGGRVFFETAQGLVGGDTNGKADVYMWQDGELSLISTGKGAGRSEFVDASADGDDVFFTTRDRLVGSDVDEQVDIYDARVDGGFAEQQIPPECGGDECQGPLAVAPKLTDLAGEARTGDRSTPKKVSLTVRSLSSAQRRRLASGRRVALVVRVNRSGRLVVRGTARVGEKKRVVVSASTRVPRAGNSSLGLRLSRVGRRKLAVGGRLRVLLSVRFGGVSRSMPLTLVQASNGRRGQ